MAALTNLEIFDGTRCGLRLRRFLESNREVFWMRKNIKEPACESGQSDEDAEESDEETGHQAREEKH